MPSLSLFQKVAVCGMFARNKDKHAEDAVVAAFLMLEALSEHNEAFNNSIQVRIGISSGSAILAIVQENDKLSFDVLGETTVMASRSESSGSPNCIHITGDTYERLSERLQAKFRPRREMTIFKNIGELQTYITPMITGYSGVLN
jgi:class 3 adenylate cyclase